MMVDPGELKEFVTVYGNTGEAYDELNMKTDEQIPLFNSFAKLDDVTGTEAAIAGAKTDQRTYRLLLPVHPDYPVDTYGSVSWCEKTLYIEKFQLLGDYREWLLVFAVFTDGIQ